MLLEYWCSACNCWCFVEFSGFACFFLFCDFVCVLHILHVGVMAASKWLLELVWFSEDLAQIISATKHKEKHFQKKALFEKNTTMNNHPK